MNHSFGFRNSREFSQNLANSSANHNIDFHFLKSSAKFRQMFLSKLSTQIAIFAENMLVKFAFGILRNKKSWTQFAEMLSSERCKNLNPDYQIEKQCGKNTWNRPSQRKRVQTYVNLVDLVKNVLTSI